MKPMLKRILALCMSFLLMMTIFPNVVNASENATNDNGDMEEIEGYNCGYCGKNVRWKYADGTVTISGTGPMDSYREDGFGSHDVDEFEFNYTPSPWSDFNVSKVVIENGVTTIGNASFAKSNVSEISIPNSITKIGSFAFYGCKSLSNITIPDSVTELGKAVFYGTALKEIVIPDSVKRMGEFFVSYCKELTSASLPKQLYEIPRGAFYDCEKLTKIVVPGTVSSIGEYAFVECPNLTVYGKSGSAMEEYANMWGINFVSSEEFKVIFQNEDGTVLSEQMVQYGQAAKEPETPIKESDPYSTYEFAGWNDDFSCVKSDMVITAYYVETQRKYKVSFEANGGTAVDAQPFEAIYEERVGTLPKCTRSGYQFRGWYTDSKQGEEVTADTLVKDDLVIYAHWKSLKPEKVKVTIGKKIGKLDLRIKLNTYLFNISGYEIQYSTSENYDSSKTESVSLKEAYKLSKILGNLAKGETYYIRIRAISHDKDSTGNYVYGDWSNSLKIKL